MIIYQFVSLIIGPGCISELCLRTFVGLLELRLRGKVRHISKR